jgi:hypothetical protein
LKNVGFLAKTGTHSFKTKKKWKKKVKTLTWTLCYTPLWCIWSPNLFFGWWVISSFAKNVLMEKLENCIYYGIKSAKIHHLPYCPYVWCRAIFLWNFLLNYWILFYFLKETWINVWVFLLRCRMQDFPFFTISWYQKFT